MNKIRNAEKEKMNLKKLSRIIFGRTTILLTLFAVQIWILMSFFYVTQEYMNYYFGGFVVLSVLVITYIINSPINPNFKLAWIVPILVIPVVGTLFYLFVRLDLGSKRLKEHLRRIFQETKPLLAQDADTLAEVRAQNSNVSRLANYMMNTSGYPIYKNSAAKYFPIGEDAFEEMKNQLKMAKRFIFMEYFIIEHGRMLGEIQEILVQKVREGVEVRFMYDGMVSLSQMPNSYPQELAKLGIRAKQFSPIKPILSTSYNNRDHRKILVIDGNVAFTGGINIADEYINEKPRFGHWKDNAIMVTGEAVRSFTLMFLQLWNFDQPHLEDVRRYLDEPKHIDNPQGYIMPYGDSPLDDERVGENVYLDMIGSAKDYVYIMTPYLILDDSMVTELKFAAKSGIDVRIMMPHIPDKKYAYALARTYYEELIQSDVKIYEYTPGFVHAKVFISDDIKATVGTVNLDYRSLYLHFENGVYLFGGDVVQEVKRDFMETLEKCQRITPEAAKNMTLMQRFVGRFVLRLFAPLL